MTQDELKKAVGWAALQYVQPGTIVGVGTGSTAAHFIDALGTMKGQIEGAVSSSDASTEKLKSLGITVFDLNEVDRLGIYVDGADEINGHMQMIKGGGAALTREKIIASVAAGIPFAEYEQWIGEKATIFRIIPNTAISQMQSMTLLASHNASKEQEALLTNIFNEMGVAMLIDEKQMGAATALTSCGIAYVLKYIQAAMQAGVEMGIYPKDAARMVAQSVKGAAELILTNESHPSVEIDKVTTPGGLTIKGINELEHGGFTSAIINAMKASLK